MAKKVSSIKHKTDTRVHIPSKEEAGYEDANPKVSTGKKVLELPKNPVVHRGQDPELFWLGKYENDDRDEVLKVDIRSLYRHEHIAPETLIKNLYKVTEEKSSQIDMFSVNELFGNALEKDELDKVSEYYQHQDGWTNRLIQGDSHLVMASLLEREGMAGQVQMIYIDPPYGIAYNSNWQIKLNDREVKDGSDDSITGEPEVISAFRDTWELGVHSYLSYLRDRLIVARELLHESGSCFIQINDENVHLVRCVLDEVFGSENEVATIVWKKGTPDAAIIRNSFNYILWYCKKKAENGKQKVKAKKLFFPRRGDEGTTEDPKKLALWGEFKDGVMRTLTTEEKRSILSTREKAKVFRVDKIIETGNDPKRIFELEFEGVKYTPPKGSQWRGDKVQMERLKSLNRIVKTKDGFGFKFYIDDYPIIEVTNLWEDTAGNIKDMRYVVQTNEKIVQRCMLMCTDPGDLVLDPTCGSGTTARVAEQFGRRWITIDTSRIALNIAKQWLMTNVYPYYKLHDETLQDIRLGFKYKSAPHITLKSLANNEPSQDETLYDQPEEDGRKLRVSGPFTVETLQNFEPVTPEELDSEVRVNEEEGAFEEVVKQHLLSAGIKNGRKDEMVVFRSIELLSHSYLHAEGFYMNGVGEKKAYFHIGPKFGTVSKTAVNEAVKECRTRGDAGWLIILGFSFESDIAGSTQTMSMGKFEVTKARIHDDLLQEGLKKKPAKSAASFVTIGEPDIYLGNFKQMDTIKDALNRSIDDHFFKKEVILKVKDHAVVVVKGLDIYDPIKDQIKPRDVHDIAYWMVDDDYDGSNFVVKQVFFCGGDKAEFAKWRKGLDNLAKDGTKKKVEKTLKIEIDDDAFDRLYGYVSHPIEIKSKDQKIAVRIISQFGEESTKVITV